MTGRRVGKSLQARGRSTCDLQRLSDGRVRLLERFSWDSRAGTGTNVLEEVEE